MNVKTVLTVRLKMLKLPLEFMSSATASGISSEPWLIQSGSYSSSCVVPSEFGGPGGAFSPEDLFLQALINCFIGTFKVYAKASKLSFNQIGVLGFLTLDHNSAGAARMQKCELKINLFGVEKPDRVRALVDKVLRDGFILNSVTTEIHHQLIIHENQNASSHS